MEGLSKIRVGKKIRMMRNALGVSQHQLADHLGVDPARVNRIENGGAFPTHDQFVQIARFLGTSVHFLYGESNSRSDLTVFFAKLKNYNSSIVSEILRLESDTASTLEVPEYA